MSLVPTVDQHNWVPKSQTQALQSNTAKHFNKKKNAGLYKRQNSAL